MSALLWDTHIHLDFYRDPAATAREAEQLGLGLFAMTTAPADFERVRPMLRELPNVRLCVGLHPWWAADGRCGPEEAARAAELIRESRFVGEIGLDASPKHVPEGSLPLQERIFGTLCSACAESSHPEEPKILSIHAVKSAGPALDILEGTGCLRSCRCIFHWFTGSNEELTRAIRAGCFFSINPMMLSTRRGREYARQIPAGRLLTETDLPPGRDVTLPAAGIAAALGSVLSELNSLRGTDMQPVISQNSESLLRGHEDKNRKGKNL